jgi:hypothetical protein
VAEAHPVRIAPDAPRVARAAHLASAALRALLLRSRLDSLLIAGADVRADPALALRARRLIRPRYRRRLASSVERLVDDLHGDPGSYVSSAIPFRLDQVADAQLTLQSLAGALRDVDSVDPRGVAMTLRLLTDSTSPLYGPAPRGALQAAVRAALHRLMAQSQPWCGLPEVPPPPREGESSGHR